MSPKLPVDVTLCIIMITLYMYMYLYMYIFHFYLNFPLFIFFFRNIFERAVNLKVSVQKIKALFKKYLAFEEQHGTPSTATAVKEKAKEFVMQRNLVDE